VITLADCFATVRPYILFGRTRYSASCTTCGTSCSGWTERQARAEFEAHRAIPAPPDDVLAAPLTQAIVAEYPYYYIRGRGHRLAAITDCGHGYWLTDSCPCCP
jgi:hypothetical protein